MMIRRPPPRRVKNVRMNDAEWRLVEAAAAQRENYPSSWLRDTAIREARRELAGNGSEPGDR